MSQRIYEMPPVELGDIVYWYPGGKKDDCPHVAIVTAMAQNTVCCNIVLPNSYNMMIRDGVRHVGDPGVREQERTEQGGWDYTPTARKLQLLQWQFNELMEAATSPKAE